MKSVELNDSEALAEHQEGDGFVALIPTDDYDFGDIVEFVTEDGDVLGIGEVTWAGPSLLAHDADESDILDIDYPKVDYPDDLVDIYGKYDSITSVSFTLLRVYEEPSVVGTVPLSAGSVTIQNVENLTIVINQD